MPGKDPINRDRASTLPLSSGRFPHGPGLFMRWVLNR